MTPLELDIMLHYYCRADDWRDGDHSAPICKDTFHWFLSEGLMTHASFHVERFDDGKLKARYVLTDRGKAYVEALKQVPLPEQIWVVSAQPERRTSTLSVGRAIEIAAEASRCPPPRKTVFGEQLDIQRTASTLSSQKSGDEA